MPDESDSRRSRSEGGRAAPLWLSLDIVHDAGDWPDAAGAERLIAETGAALAAAPRFAGEADAEACVALSDDAAVQALNRRYRGKDTPTNVLSFPAPAGAPPGVRRALGDIVLAQETLQREARDQGIPLAHHLQHLVVHGLLHLLGFDHETERDAREMETLEAEILSRLGIPDPYRDQATPVTQWP